MSMGADFSRTCEGCEYIRTEPWPVKGSYSEKTIAIHTAVTSGGAMRTKTK